MLTSDAMLNIDDRLKEVAEKLYIDEKQIILNVINKLTKKEPTLFGREE